jgi:hypothetical protein
MGVLHRLCFFLQQHRLWLCWALRVAHWAVVLALIPRLETLACILTTIAEVAVAEILGAELDDYLLLICWCVINHVMNIQTFVSMDILIVRRCSSSILLSMICRNIFFCFHLTMYTWKKRKDGGIYVLCAGSDMHTQVIMNSIATKCTRLQMPLPII